MITDFAGCGLTFSPRTPSDSATTVDVARGYAKFLSPFKAVA